MLKAEGIMHSMQTTSMKTLSLGNNGGGKLCSSFQSSNAQVGIKMRRAKMSPSNGRYPPTSEGIGKPSATNAAPTPSSARIGPAEATLSIEPKGTLRRLSLSTRTARNGAMRPIATPSRHATMGRFSHSGQSACGLQLNLPRNGRDIGAPVSMDETASAQAWDCAVMSTSTCTCSGDTVSASVESCSTLPSTCAGAAAPSALPD
mmetsp:Transcript_73126/g.169582  ORF Transcript_73126/g.169582 Transcript_73126/m.169582 type:complete len:204 (+) Transcript_73126:256-867(+)